MMKHINAILAVCVIGAVIGFARPASASILYPVAQNPDVSIDDVFSVDLRLDTNGAFVNTVEATLVYDTSLLELQSISTGSSFLTLWAEYPETVAPGRLHLTGGRPNGTLSAGGVIVTMSFRALREGTASVRVVPESSGVYLNDSQGTADALTVQDCSIPVGPVNVLSSQPWSSSHPDSSVWSSSRTFVVRWTPIARTVVSYRISRDPSADPDDVGLENTGTTSFPDLSDGIWYFSFKERLAGYDWSDVSRREVRIDTAAPDPFSVTVSGGNVPLVTFGSEDRGSGIASYTAEIVRSHRWRPWVRNTETMYVKPGFVLDDLPSVISVKVTAADYADNRTSATWTNKEIAGSGTLIAVCLFLICCGLGMLLLALLRRHRVRNGGKK